MKPLVQVESLGRTSCQRRVLARARGLLESILSIDKLNALYLNAVSSRQKGDFFGATLTTLGISYNLAPRDLANVPFTGPVVVVANHPFGGVDGLVLCSVLTSMRRDVKILGNYVLKSIPELKEMVIAVDPFKGEGAARGNVRPLLEAVRWVREGGMLIVFPGRQVSHFRLEERAVSDAPWSPTVAGIIRRANATVLPVYFDGRNSLIFQMAGFVSPSLRTLLLPHELINKRAKEVDVRIGPQVTWSRLKECDSDREMVNYLRLRTYALANRSPYGAAAVTARRSNPLEALPVLPEPIVPPVPPALLRAEVEALPAESKLAQVGSLTAFCAKADSMPNLLREIGRLREVTFRAEDEGTGRSCDNDEYDEHYHHLFLWDEAEGRVGGAYRMGLVPEIMKSLGVRGLYTNLLFKYHPALWERWRHAIELGRAFVRPEYQRQHAPLLALWRGLFQFVARRPDYNIFFGPLSISRAYSQASKSAIDLYVRARMHDAELARFASARNPFRPSRLEGMRSEFFLENVRDLNDLSAVVASVEQDGKGIPVLFRQYARFDFRVLDFNVNRYFSSTVDGLMYVDLTRVNPSVMRRLMGAEAYSEYASHHLALAE